MLFDEHVVLHYVMTESKRNYIKEINTWDAK